MWVHQQFATNSGFTTGVVDYYTQVEGSDWEATSATIGGAASVGIAGASQTFAQPSGTYYQRARFETVPGDPTNNVVSPWSTTQTDTITSSAAAWTPSGTAVSPYLNITNGNLSFVTNNSIGAMCCTLASIHSQNASWQAELSFDGFGASGFWCAGITDGSLNFSSPGYQSGSSSVFPGNTASGITFQANAGSTNVAALVNSSSQNITLPHAAGVGDRLILKVDQAGKNIYVYHYSASANSVSSLLSTITLTTAPSSWYLFGGGYRGTATVATSDSGTLICNSASFKRPLDSGYSIYG
jgi:hypothetical protein